MLRILGIDPGSRITGWGVIDAERDTHRHVASGVLKLGDGPLPGRLKAIYEGLIQVIDEHRPDEIAVEQVFVNRNPDSALKLGQARGAALCACVARTLTVAEYAPRAVKQAMVGRGGADKVQVQHMVKVLLTLREVPAEDAADALAVAICHSHTRTSLARVVKAVQEYLG